MTSVATNSPRRAPAPAAALLLVQAVLGYEWLVSGVSKIHNGDFPAGLAGTLAGLAAHAPAWYGRFLESAVVPHAVAIGYLVEIAEVAVGGTFLVCAACGLRGRGSARLLASATTVAALAGIALLANFELAHGGSFGVRLAADSFDEGVDLDTVLIALQLALVVSTVPVLRAARRPQQAIAPASVPFPIPVQEN